MHVFIVLIVINMFQILQIMLFPALRLGEILNRFGSYVEVNLWGNIPASQDGYEYKMRGGGRDLSSTENCQDNIIMFII